MPDFVRASLARLGVPGYRVFRWERHWHTPEQPFRDPSEYPARIGRRVGHARHRADGDLVGQAPQEERQKVADLPSFGSSPAAPTSSTRRSSRWCATCCSRRCSPRARICCSLPIQDVFGWRDRINQPATVTGDNWTYRLPWPIDRLDEIPEARERRDRLRAWSEKHGR